MKAKLADTKTERDEAFSLRYKTFHDTLKWISANDNRLDVDTYDLDSVHPVVIHDGHVVATCRLTPYGKPWMLTDIFHYIVLTEPLVPESAELSRLSISTSIPFAQRFEAFKSLVQFAATLAPPFVYAVTTQARSIVYSKLGIKCVEIGAYNVGEDPLSVLKIDNHGTDWYSLHTL